MLPLNRFVKHVAGGAVSVALMLGLGLVAQAQAQAQVAVTIDGSDVDLSPPPTIEAGRVFVPLRGVFERLGASVVYSNGTINATGNGRTISLQIGSTQATIDGRREMLDVAPYITGASTYVPLRFVSEALGANVGWDDTNRVVSIETSGGRTDVGQGNAAESDYAPPPNPDYEQPYVPAPNYLWQPGYWQWDQYGYYWVPGTWVQAPQQGYLWTPGYWQSNNGGYSWNQGYWAKSVGYYGGVNYGGGYNGDGYNGARWSGNSVDYNTSVSRVNGNGGYRTYADPNVNSSSSQSRISYNGGAHGVSARPSATQLSVAHAQHLGLTAAQQQHVKTAAQDRRQLAKVNNNKPPTLVVARPLSAAPVGAVAPQRSDIVKSTVAPKPVTPVIAHPAAVVAHPAAVVAHPAAVVAHPAAVVAHPAAVVAHPAAVVAHPTAVVAHPAAVVAHPAAVVAHPAAVVAHPAAVPAAIVAHPAVVHPAVVHAAPAMHAAAVASPAAANAAKAAGATPKPADPKLQSPAP